ncbi:hypothetical protein [uncultured Litoreibacter sp.]|nr:hypothetical protein [uncultured Litoreibacter sp.]
MFTVILRHYRRIGIFSTGMAALCLSLVAHSGAGISSAGHLVFFALSLVGFAFVALGLYSVKPGQRGILEIAGASGVISTLLLLYLPLTGLFNAVIGIAVFFGVLTSTWFFLHSSISRKIGARTTWRARHSCNIAYPAKLVWKHVVPGATAAEDHCTGMVESYGQDPHDEDTLHIKFKGRRTGRAAYDVTFLEKDAPNFCRFYFEGNEADGTLVDGIFSLSIDVLDRENCTIIANEERSGLSLGALIERWFDDALGFQHDRLLELLDERYGDGAGVTKPLKASEA